MRALESSPVHCLNRRPWGNRCRPGKDGAAAILNVDLSEKEEKKKWLYYNTYRRSMSSKISFARVWPCSSTRYSPTHVTRWSLNVPLISWCKRSGERISCMSAHGKLNVNGCSKVSSHWHTRMSEHIQWHHHQFHTCPINGLNQVYLVIPPYTPVFGDLQNHQDHLEGLCIWQRYD